MVQSALASRVVPHHNKLSSRQGRSVLKFLPHHWAGLGGGDARLTDPNQQASANYIIYNDGTLAVQVPEEYRAWTSGSFDADGDAITVEVQNESTQINGNDDDPNSWRISAAAQNTLINLAADVAKRYGWGAVTQTNWVMHRMFYQTACPGGFMMANRPNFINKAHAILTGKAGAPAPSTPPAQGKTVWQLADEVLAGVHGNGADRQASLGANYAAVQAEVDRRLGAGPAPTQKAPAQKSISQLADEVMAGAHGTGMDRQVSLGGNYPAVQAEINRRLGAGSAAPAGAPNISQLADAVLRGEYGNGADRQARLGANFAAVQAEVDRRFGVAAPVAAKKSVSQLADEVMAGLHGNGADRERSLGGNFAAVQAEINRRFS